MSDLLIGAGILAAVQLAGVLLCQVIAPSDARDVREGLLAATFWWVLVPWSSVSRRRRRARWAREARQARERRARLDREAGL